MSEITDKIKSKGYWDVVIRPTAFREDRVDYEALEGTLEPIAVRLRGWPVPYFDHRTQPLRGDDWVGQDINAEMVSHYEAWRFFTSGQFQQLRSVSADWRRGAIHLDEAVLPPPEFTELIEIWEILFYLTEVFELAARLAVGPAGDESMTVAAALKNLGKRGLIVGQPNRMPFNNPYGPPPDPLGREVTIGRDALVADPRGQAVDMSREFLVRFGWKPSREQLLDHQSELVG